MLRTLTITNAFTLSEAIKRILQKWLTERAVVLLHIHTSISEYVAEHIFENPVDALKLAQMVSQVFLFFGNSIILRT